MESARSLQLTRCPNPSVFALEPVDTNIEVAPEQVDEPKGKTSPKEVDLTDQFARARTIAGHPTVRLHDLRHYSITQLLAAGVDPVTVSNRVGHSTTTMTLDRYGHMVPARDQQAADMIRDITLGESGT